MVHLARGRSLLLKFATAGLKAAVRVMLLRVDVRTSLLLFFLFVCFFNKVSLQFFKTSPTQECMSSHKQAYVKEIS